MSLGNKDLQTISFKWDRNSQLFTIKDKIADTEVVLNKTQMFSTGITIDQIKRSMFMHKGIMNRLKKLKETK